LLKNGWISLQSLVDSVNPENLVNFPKTMTRSSDLMQIFFTSGTTGAPKMVGHTHGSYGHCHWVLDQTNHFKQNKIDG
jgi:medium-chain acyl-CoA synthetase